MADKDTIREKTNEKGKNLLHIYCENVNQHQSDVELMNEVYDVIVNSGLDQYQKDNDGRIPLHYCYMKGNMRLAQKLLSECSTQEKIEVLSTQDNDQVSVFGMLFHGISQGGSGSPLTPEVYSILREDTKKLNPFVKFRKEYFPYTQIAYSLQDGDMIHPVILMNDKMGELHPQLLEYFDFVGIGSPDKGYSLICQMLLLGRVSMLSMPVFRTTISKYLEDARSIKFIEETLAKPNIFGAHQNVTRIQRFLWNQFRVKVEIQVQEDENAKISLVKEKVKESFDYVKDSEDYLDTEIPKLQDEMKSDRECVLDSSDNNEKHCYVVKDEDETKFFYDAMMKKVDIKKYYYGLDNFYVLQLLYDSVKNIYIVWTRWGRSGTDGQYQRTPLKKEDAIKEFKRIFKQKTGFKWEEVKDYVKVDKKYTIKRIGGKLISNSKKALKFSNADFDYTKLLIPWEKLDSSVPMKNPEEFKYFIQPLTTDNNMMSNFTYSNFSRSLMVLAPQDKETVEDAIDILLKMKKLLEECRKHQGKQDFPAFMTCMQEVENLNSEYMEVIPKTNPTTIEALLNIHQVDNEIKNLRSIYTLSYSVRSMLGAYLNKEKVNPYDYILGTLDINMSIVDPNSEETNLILHYLNSDQSSGYNLRNIIKVEELDYSEEDNETFYDAPNHMMLWHGTGANNILNIMRKGLKIAPAEAFQHGSRYGKGLYFSDSFALSSCYSSESESEKYILLCEVATGRMVNILSMSNQNLKKTKDYDCIRVIPTNGPNWDGSVVKNDVVYPIGRSITYPKAAFNTMIKERKRQSSKSRRSSSKRSSGASSRRSSRRNKKAKVEDMGDYEIEEHGIGSEETSEEESEEEESKFIKPAYAIGANKIPDPRKGQNKNKKNELMIFENDDNEVYPLLPNQITAATKDDIKQYRRNLNNIYSYNGHSEYIIYDDALVRVKYIVQLSSRSKAFLKKQMNGGNGNQANRYNNFKANKYPNYGRKMAKKSRSRSRGYGGPMKIKRRKGGYGF